MDKSTRIQPAPEQDNYLHKGAVLQRFNPGPVFKGLEVAERYCGTH